MPEWWHTLWSYRLGDLLMFSPLAHARLFELVNRETWPAALAAATLPALLAWALLSRYRHGESLALGVLALATAAMAELHLRQSLAGLTTAALPWAVAFGLLSLAALGLALLSWRGAASTPVPGGQAAHTPAMPMIQQTAPLLAPLLPALLAALALAWPLAAPALGRPWWQAEVFALAPDPTVLGWLAWAARTPRRGWAWVAFAAVPLAWCVFAGAMGTAMASPLAAVLPMAAAAVVVSRLMPDRRSARDGGGGV